MSEANDSDETGRVTVLRVRARALAGAVRDRFEGSPAHAFVKQLGALDFVNTSILFGAALLTSVLPFIILLSALANHRIDSGSKPTSVGLLSRDDPRRIFRPAWPSAPVCQR